MIKKIQDFFMNKNESKPMMKKNFAHYFTNYDSGHDSWSDNKAVKLYNSNVIVHRCVNLIAQAASHVPWNILLKNKNLYEKSTDHPLVNLLNRPNNKMAGAEFFEQLIVNKLIFGNSFIEMVVDKQDMPIELHILSPNDITVVSNKDHEVVAYKYQKHSKTEIYRINPIDNASHILHLKNYNPNNPAFGLSSLSAAFSSIEQHNLAITWNNALLKNGARPSGAIVVNQNNGNNGYLTEEQFERIKDQFKAQYTGCQNSGKPMLLEGGVEWRDMSISPKDMDFIDMKNSAAREIALALGVPPQLLGIIGDNTYSNMQEARLALWEETVIPLLDNICDSLTNWFAQKFKQNLKVKFDIDGISALSKKREAILSQIANLNFMTINEKRNALGLAPLDNCDSL